MLNTRGSMREGTNERTNVHHDQTHNHSSTTYTTIKHITTLLLRSWVKSRIDRKIGQKKIDVLTNCWLIFHLRIILFLSSSPVVSNSKMKSYPGLGTDEGRITKLCMPKKKSKDWSSKNEKIDHIWSKIYDRIEKSIFEDRLINHDWKLIFDRNQ